MTFDFHSDAEAEFLEAIEFYESRKAGLGRDFSMEVFSTIQKVLDYPTSWPILTGKVRRCLTNRFPYGVLYFAEPERVLILAVMHLHRKPDYWSDRQ